MHTNINKSSHLQFFKMKSSDSFNFLVIVCPWSIVHRSPAIGLGKIFTAFFCRARDSSIPHVRKNNNEKKIPSNKTNHYSPKSNKGKQHYSHSANAFWSARWHDHVMLQHGLSPTGRKQKTRAKSSGMRWAWLFWCKGHCIGNKIKGSFQNTTFKFHPRKGQFQNAEK